MLDAGVEVVISLNLAALKTPLTTTTTNIRMNAVIVPKDLMKLKENGGTANEMHICGMEKYKVVK